MWRTESSKVLKERLGRKITTFFRGENSTCAFRKRRDESKRRACYIFCRKERISEFCSAWKDEKQERRKTWKTKSKKDGKQERRKTESKKDRRRERRRARKTKDGCERKRAKKTEREDKEVRKTRRTKYERRKRGDVVLALKDGEFGTDKVSKRQD